MALLIGESDMKDRALHLVMRSLYDKLRFIEDEYSWHATLPRVVTAQPEQHWQETLKEYRYHPGIEQLLHGLPAGVDTDARLVTPLWRDAVARCCRGIETLLYAGVVGGVLTLPLREEFAPAMALVAGALGFAYGFVRQRATIPTPTEQWAYITAVVQRVRASAIYETTTHTA